MKLFNPQGSDRKQDRQIFGGNTTYLINLNNVKYDWAVQLYKQMAGNFWLPEKVDLTKDKKDYQELTTAERRAFIGIFSYLIYLDSVQVNNLPYLSMPITAPEVKICIGMQLQQETVHAASYQYEIESIIEPQERDNIYDYWRTDDVLRPRCEYIASIFQEYVDDPNEESLQRALFADYLLEGVYFYSGFQFFFNLASRNMMQGTADMITYIMRDELTHVRLFQKILSNLDLDHSMCRALAAYSGDQEMLWASHILKDDILGLPQKTVQQYIMWLVNSRLNALGIEGIYDVGTKNPLAHLDRLADVQADASVKGNFFEATVTSYNQASSVNGWDF